MGSPFRSPFALATKPPLLGSVLGTVGRNSGAKADRTTVLTLELP
jgi:hypothetical protein